MGFINWNFFFPSKKNNLELIWDITTRVVNSNYNRPSVIPILVDFYVTPKKINRLYKAYQHNPFILVSSMEAFAFLKDHNFPKTIYHFPLSIADKYKISPTTKYEKIYDLVMARPNPVLENYAKKYAENNKDFIYVYRRMEGKDFNYYTSNGELLGNCNSREDYLNLMRKSKIGLYATQSMDVEAPRTRGYNQVTPRFLEFIACGCHVIARYKKNPDTEYYQLDRFCRSIETYEQFEKEMDRARHTDVDMNMYSDYLENHYTSKRVELFKTILKQENIVC
jgi:hypothetical protein